MINLIPAEAKKHLVKEYWVRSVTVWFFLWSFVLVLGVAVLAPTFVLINLQVKAYSDSAQTADEKNANFGNVASELERDSTIAATLSDHFSYPTMTEYLTLLKKFESVNITITELSLERTGDGVGPIKIVGVARDRQALATFRARMLEDQQIESVDFPISNLAKDKQIPFDLTVTMVKQKTP
jgi:hypothetical protein